MPRQEIKKTSAFGAGFLGGAKDGIRTRDPDLGKVVLYQLSYFRLKKRGFGSFKVSD